MGMFEWNETQASSFRAINAPGAYDPPNPVRASGLTDLEADQDFWSSILA